MARKLDFSSVEGDLAQDRYSLGLDISPRNCGLAMSRFDGSLAKTQFLDLGPVGDDADNEGSLHYLFSSLLAFCAECPPRVVTIEDYAFEAHHRVSWNAERVGVAKLTCSKFLKYQPALLRVAPTSLKKFAWGSGTDSRDSKEATQFYCERQGWFDIPTTHERDATVLSQIGVFSFRTNKCLERKPSEVVEMMRYKFLGS